MRYRVVMALALALLSSSAGAQGEAEEASAARAAFADGSAEFKLGHWQAAAAAWERGYKLKADPVFLYNIAQAYRLAGAADKALFYYRGYLRDAPEASNREQVAERVAQLERVVGGERAAGSAPSPDATTSPPPAEPPAATVHAAAAAPERRRPFDLEADVGVATWAAGVPTGTGASLAVALGAGYTALERGRLQLRAGLLATYSYLRDVAGTDHFVTLLFDPLLRLMLWRQRLLLDGELGLGVQLVAGLGSGSPLLAAGASGGTRAAFALRPALALEFRVAQPLALRAGIGVGYSPLGDFAATSLVRIDLTLAVVLRF